MAPLNTILLCTGAVFAVAAAQDPSVVTLPNGAVKGLVFATHRAFLGVPYGAPPVGPLRWAPPVARAAWAPAVWDATADAPGCPQVCTEDEPPHICPPVAKQSEDCLFLNVFTPLAAPATPSPVLLFLHGGNFHDGYAGGYALDGGLLYDGHEFVNTTGQILLVVNYRLGALGFLFAGGASKNTTISGNFGLMDQVLAMEWARANVGAFGGDPDRVTLIGQSAGAMSISVHLTRPQTQGLYAGAIQHSNPFAEPWRSPPEALAIAAGFANFTGCGADWISAADWAPLEACLRGLDAPAIVAAAMSAELDLLADLDAILQVVVAWGPTVGTDYLPLRPLEAFQRGLVNDVPIAIGTTANETVIFVYEVLDFPLPALLYEAAVALLVSPEALPAVMALYPLPDPVPGDLRVFASSVLTDALFLCPTRNATEALLAAQPARRSKIYHYQYSHMLSWANQAWGKNFTECDTEVCHGSDLPAWFMPRVSPAPGFGDYTQAELDLGHVWQRYWASFAATGDPGAPAPNASSGGLAWPAYDVTSRPTMNLETADNGGLAIVPQLRADFCKFWDENGYRLY